VIPFPLRAISANGSNGSNGSARVARKQHESHETVALDGHSMTERDTERTGESPGDQRRESLPDHATISGSE